MQNRELSLTEMNQAVKMIETDGVEAFHAVAKLYGLQTAQLLCINLLRRCSGLAKGYPANPELDDKIIDQVRQLGT